MNFLQFLTPLYPNISIRFCTLFPPTPFPDLLWGALLPFIYDPSFCISLYSTVQEFCSIIYSLPLYIYLKTSPSFCFIASIYNHFPAITLFKQTQNFVSFHSQAAFQKYCILIVASFAFIEHCHRIHQIFTESLGIMREATKILSHSIFFHWLFLALNHNLPLFLTSLHFFCFLFF